VLTKLSQILFRNFAKYLEKIREILQNVVKLNLQHFSEFRIAKLVNQQNFSNYKSISRNCGKITSRNISTHVKILDSDESVSPTFFAGLMGGWAGVQVRPLKFQGHLQRPAHRQGKGGTCTLGTGRLFRGDVE
jgi:hypothetical protein